MLQNTLLKTGTLNSSKFQTVPLGIFIDTSHSQDPTKYAKEGDETSPGYSYRYTGIGTKLLAPIKGNISLFTMIFSIAGYVKKPK